MWLKTWILGNARMYHAKLNDNGSGLRQTGWSSFPPTNAQYGSLRDGPAIDIKSRRRVRLDERLFFAVVVRPMPFLSDDGYTSIVEGLLNIRIYGNLVKARGSGAF